MTLFLPARPRSGRTTGVVEMGVRESPDGATPTGADRRWGLGERELALRLPPHPASVAEARRLLTAGLRDRGRADLVDDAAIVVSELVSNAVMHAGTEIALRCLPTAHGVRVEVADGSPDLPVTPLAVGVSSISGRGLALVESVALRWGAERETGGGKTVWCELDGLRPPEPDVTPEQLLDAWVRLDDAAARPALSAPVVVTLPDMDTAALLATREHSDNLIRELKLVLLTVEGGDADSPADSGLLELARRLDAAAQEFADARRQLRSAAVRARGDHRDTVTARLSLTPEDGPAALRYLAALEEADALAGTGALLVEAASPQQRDLRRWYLQQIAMQIAGIST